MEIYMKMKDISLEGNLIDSGWIENLKYENWKTNLNAVMILSENSILVSTCRDKR